MNKELSFLRHVFETAVVWEWLSDNPASRIPREKVRNCIERWLSPEEERLVRVCLPGLQKMERAKHGNSGSRRGENNES